MTPPRDRPQAPVQPPPSPVEQPQILRRPPQVAAAIPPLPKEPGERVVNVIHLESKGKEKVGEPKVMPIERTRTKKARVNGEVTGPLASMETKEEGTSKKKRKKRASTQSQITIKDFPLGSKKEPYDLGEDVSSQGPNFTWP